MLLSGPTTEYQTFSSEKEDTSSQFIIICPAIVVQ